MGEAGNGGQPTCDPARASRKETTTKNNTMANERRNSYRDGGSAEGNDVLVGRSGIKIDENDEPAARASWNALHSFLQPVWPVPEHYAPLSSPPQHVVQAFAHVIEMNAQEELFDWYKGQICRCFKNVKNETVGIAAAHEKHSPAHQLVFQLVERWHVIFLTWYDPLRVLTPEDASASSLYSKYFYTLLLSCIPDSFPAAIKKLFALDFTTSSSLLFRPTSTYPFSSLLGQLTKLGLLKRFQPILFSVGYDAIDERIETVCRGEWLESSSASLEGMIGWFRQEIGVWLLKVLEAADQCMTPSSDQPDMGRVIEIVRPAMSRFEYHIYKSLSELRINELFDIIVDFPETMPVLQDLKICLNKTDQRAYLVHKLRAANTRRLLHPGADTQDIITQYISLMKALRVLDPPGVLLSCVAQPVRVYLRNREDTIRCIVTSLVEPGHSLGDELDQIPDNDNAAQGLSSGLPIQEENDYQLTDWMPDPVDAPIGYKSLLKDDVIESLVSIYENRDGFVKELQTLLASRLLAVKGFDVTQELTRIEILKGKFGEANLQPCDIMLKDLSDSKRIDTAVHEIIPKAPIHPIIISRLFWPNLASSAFRFSPRLVELLKAFEQTYTSQKVDRRLRWLPQLGSVEIDVELEDRTLSLEVTTLQASVIELFGTSDTWTFAQLRSTLRIQTDLVSLRNALYFWSNQEVLKEVESGIWKLFETRESYKSSSIRPARALT
ncbi:hypothetical protein PTTG_01338 [Puccinia triticina 1-1 BBBD Race 1]|uniref:CULLIN_2 domain-containing protein n=2 Tax=Puccinia triticina TaxID=208348 RepID=A0A180GZ51_PUCT1|nr:uncharacterized protein PtA15_15A323 [Puccinia triticina]OAV97804.1 hypothetical protein PTTG_01338 [Puccinia triticina 1-1 BBBD Race 1]WAQ91930.1 hypothetical protein PtA15_15A323 [Puccinia triticina]WAR62735.1 hypothetical protein PtB15_15B322 [Puccinia triticina]